MKENLKKAYHCVLLSVSIANILATIYFGLFLRRVERGLEGYLPFNFEQFLAFQANQFSLLQVYLVVFSLILAVLAFFGFSIIKDAAKEVAKEEGDKIYKRAIEMVRELIGRTEKTLGLPSHNVNDSMTDTQLTEVTKRDR